LWLEIAGEKNGELDYQKCQIKKAKKEPKDILIDKGRIIEISKVLWNFVQRSSYDMMFKAFA